MERCRGELHLRECLIYLDDIIIFSKTFDEHLVRLENVFRQLEHHGGLRVLNVSFSETGSISRSYSQ